MRIMVTGGTGFIGSHTVRTLIENGHDVRLLVRNEDKAKSLFSPGNRSMPVFVKGDMIDQASVRECMDGCDAVFHAAAVVSLDPARAEMMIHDNRRGAEIVLKEACRRNLKSIVHVSSITSLYGPGTGALTPGMPVANSGSAYARSKIEAEKIARYLQSEGFPVRITYPSAVLGPDDPGLSEANGGLKALLENGIPLTSSGFQFIDVRDLALVHLKLLELKKGSGIFLAGGVFKSWPEMADLLEKLTGNRQKRIIIPGTLLRMLGAAFDMIRKIKPLDIPLTYEAARYATQWRLVDDSATLHDLGLTFRKPETTLSDTIRWLCKERYIRADQAGIIARDIIPE